ncbi:hypothetical protein ACFWEH_17200 [Streptomyces anulatus]|uniref:hypothetical protein n=1 Tax=Streptomyces TaxID=1883 RepID=UPI001160E388|nr:hypothetical protein [Streptomyces sp. TSRI0395]
MLKIEFAESRGQDAPLGFEEALGRGEIDMAELDAVALRYNYFVYPVSLTVDEISILPDSGVPLVDFMFCLAYSIKEIRATQHGEIDFTESSYVINITSNEGRLFFASPRGEVESSYDVDEYAEVVHSFIECAIRYIFARYPGMQRNAIIHDLLHLVDSTRQQ